MKLYLIGKGKEYPFEKKKIYFDRRKPIIFGHKKIKKAYFA